MNLESSFASLADILNLSKPLEPSSQNRITLDYTDPSAPRSSLQQNLANMYQGYEGQNKISFNLDYTEPTAQVVVDLLEDSSESDLVVNLEPPTEERSRSVTSSFFNPSRAESVQPAIRQDLQDYALEVISSYGPVQVKERKSMQLSGIERFATRLLPKHFFDQYNYQFPSNKIIRKRDQEENKVQTFREKAIGRRKHRQDTLQNLAAHPSTLAKAKNHQELLRTPLNSTLQLNLEHIRQFQQQLYGRASLQSLNEISRRQLIEYTFTNDLPIPRITRHFWPTFHFCIQKSLIPSTRPCPKCGTQMKFEKHPCKTTDGAYWRCPGIHCRNKCTLRIDTMFSCSRLTIMEQLRIICHYFVRNYNALQAAVELKEITGIMSYRSVSVLYRHVRAQIHTYTQNRYRKTKMGRFGRAVEIDESVFATVGKDGCKVWVLGFYERGSKDQRAIYVKDRTTETLTQVILENVELGAEIYTDFWRGYNGLKQYYKHRIVNKAQKGSGTSEFQTTNHVESMWSLIKRYFTAYSCFNSPYLQMFLDEALWRIKHKIYQDRIDFLVQLNSYHNYMNDDKSIEPILASGKNKDYAKLAGHKGVFRSAEEYYEHEQSQLPDFSLQTLNSTQAITCDLENEANDIINKMYGRLPNEVVRDNNNVVPDDSGVAEIDVDDFEEDFSAKARMKKGARPGSKLDDTMEDLEGDMGDMTEGLGGMDDFQF